jgi:antitoxin component YwqK of YwqJK toxin-antitoxin module
MRNFALFTSLVVSSLCLAEKKLNRNYLDDDKIKEEIISVARDASHLEWSEIGDGIKQATLSGSPYSGWVRYFYPNTKILKGLVELREGLAHGLHAYWFENGKKMEVAEWLNGKRNGLTSICYENGQKKTECTYKDGKQDGLQTEWYSNGKRSAEVTFKGGLANNGRKWLPNGDDCPISKLSNGTGVMVAYDISGKELRRFFVNNGKTFKESVSTPGPDFKETPIPAVFPE